MRIAVASLLAGLPWMLLMWFAAGLPDPASDLAIAGIVLVEFGLGSVAFWASINGFRTTFRERDAGYTTLYGTMIDGWQLDHRTGEVLRRPGESAVRRRPPRGDS